MSVSDADRSVADGPTHHKLETVELGRGLAAAAVVAFHTNAAAQHLGMASSRWLGPFQFGVDFFFVLSGFIIFHVHRADLGRPERARAYATKRFIRLYPVLWLVAGGWIVLRLVMAEEVAPGALGTSLLLYPSMALPVPNVIWTLRHEILFYLAFLVVILDRRAGMVLFAGWIAGVIWQLILIAQGTPFTGVASLILSSFALDFALGAGVAYLARRPRPDSCLPLASGALAIAAFAIAWVMFDWSRDGTLDYTSGANLLLPLNGVAFALLLYGLLCIEHRVRVPRWGVLLGGASYATYLVHVPFIAVVQPVAARLGDGFGHLALFAGSLMAGVSLHLLIEKPMTKALRSRLLPCRL